MPPIMRMLAILALWLFFAQVGNFLFKLNNSPIANILFIFRLPALISRSWVYGEEIPADIVLPGNMNPPARPRDGRRKAERQLLKNSDRSSCDPEDIDTVSEFSTPQAPGCLSSESEDE